MTNTLSKYPFLRPLIALVIGILSGSILSSDFFSNWWWLTPFPPVLFLVHRNYSYRNSGIFGLTTVFFFLLLGIILYKNNNSPPPQVKSQHFVGVCLEKPIEKDNSFKTILQVHAFDTAHFQNSRFEKLLVYIEKDSLIRELKVGDRILFSGHPRPIKTLNNPFEFDYTKYMARQAICRQVYLSKNSWNRTSEHDSKSLRLKTLRLRSRLLNRFDSPTFSQQTTEILSALTLGYKDNLSLETKQVFSSVGAMHILAVSGLHVGIVFWIMHSMLLFLEKWRYGKYLQLLLSLIILWFYAYVSGLSPSVVRACTMFSIMGIGKTLGRNTNVFNSLILSAFIILLVAPNNLFSVGFQLSYSAVFGIVFLQPKLDKLLHFKFRLIKYLWSLFTVSVSAQIATLPFCLFYFQQFPMYFWLTNLFVVPIVCLLVPMGLLHLAISTLPIPGSLLAHLLDTIVMFTFHVLEKIEDLPFSTIEIVIQMKEFVLLLLVLFFLFLFIHRPKEIFIQSFLLAVLSFFIMGFATNYSRPANKQFIVYNNKNNLILHFIKGRNNAILSEYPILPGSREEDMISRTCKNMHLGTPEFISFDDQIDSTLLLYQNGVVLFNSRLFLINPDQYMLPFPDEPDYLILSKPFGPKLISANRKTTYIYTQSPQAQHHRAEADIYYTFREGAYSEN